LRDWTFGLNAGIYPARTRAVNASEQLAQMFQQVFPEPAANEVFQPGGLSAH
jgi:hypothetical protein